MKQKTLLEDFIPAHRISKAGAHERYLRKGHPNAIKTWWARRPHTAMRAILYACLIGEPENDDEREKHWQIIDDLCHPIFPLPPSLEAAKEKISHVFPDRKPEILDFFAGGGCIPLEAALLGAKAYALELHPVAYLVQKATVELPQLYRSLADLVDCWGKWTIKQTQEALRPVYPWSEAEADEPIIYFWIRTVRCPECGAEVSLSRLNYLAKKDKNLIFRQMPTREGSKLDYQFTITETPDLANPEYHGKRICPFCKTPLTKEYLKELGHSGRIGERLVCIASVQDGIPGKKYVPEFGWAQPPLPQGERIDNLFREILPDLDVDNLDSPVKEWTGIVNPAVYGHTKIGEFYNPRQRLTLLYLIRNLRQAYYQMKDEGVPEDEARAVLIVLSALPDHLADWNSRFTMWIPQNQQAGRMLAGPGIPMRWDYIELQPFNSGPANLWGKLERIVYSLRQIPHFEEVPDVRLGSALQLPYKHKFDRIVIDPPYYDSLYYSVLADCFHPWQKMLFKGIWSELYNADFREEEEVVASQNRHGSHAAAVQAYRAMMTQALSEGERVLKDDGLLVMIYSHKTVESWNILAESILSAGFQVERSWPLQMEREARPRAMTSEALHVVVVFAMRKASGLGKIRLNANTMQGIKSNLADVLEALVKEDWSGSNLLTAVVGETFSLYTKNTITDEMGNKLSFADFFQRIEETIPEVIEEAGLPLEIELTLEKRACL